jgi:uncharacterized protein YaiI (UPF0178 family)
MQIYIDADACPVKDEVFKVAARYNMKVYVVANSYVKIPVHSLIEMCVASKAFDAVDDFIVERITNRDIAITADILLADRCIKKGARVLNTNGHEFTDDNIGSAVANRELMQNLRHMGEMHGGPAPTDKKSRSRFLGKLDEIIQSLRRQK